MDSTGPQPAEKWQVVSIITWILLIVSTLAVVARCGTKYGISKRLHLDDVFAVIALVFHIGSGASVLVEAKHGLGSPATSLSSGTREVFAKSLFAADILFIATVCFSKLSILLLIDFITRQTRHRKLVIAVGCFIIAWSVACIFATSFACQLPESWNIFSKCHDKAAFWYSFGGLNIITDLILVALPMYITIPLHMNRTRKSMLIFCFGTRILDVVVSVTQLCYTNAFRSNDITADLWQWVLLTQFVQCVTLITSCIPCLKPLLAEFPSGIFMTSGLRQEGTTFADVEYVLRSVTENGTRGSVARSETKQITRSSVTGHMGGTVTTISSKRDNSDDDITWVGEDGQIMKTTTFGVSIDSEHRSNAEKGL